MVNKTIATVDDVTPAAPVDIDHAAEAQAAIDAVKKGVNKALDKREKAEKPRKVRKAAEVQAMAEEALGVPLVKPGKRPAAFNAPMPTAEADEDPDRYEGEQAEPGPRTKTDEELYEEAMALAKKKANNSRPSTAKYNPKAPQGPQASAHHPKPG